MNKQVTNIVFTKNRPLQLEGYLESLYRHFPHELFQAYVLEGKLQLTLDTSIKTWWESKNLSASFQFP